MNQQDQMQELKPCPFCGGQPELPSGEGTFYDMCCSECGQAQVSIQICDLMTIEERHTEKFDISWHEPQYIERAKQEAIKQWNMRAAETALVARLTDEEIAEEYCKADAYLMMTDHYEFGLVANAIMDAMIEKNKGKI